MADPARRGGASRWACIAALALATGCRAAASTRPPNILLIVVDTLRADRLGCYGNPRGLTPFLDELAARSTVFRRAYAQSSWTEPSVASLFTSRFPSQHGATRWYATLDPANRTLAEVLHAHGFDTAGWSANELLHPSRGYAHGFDSFEIGEQTRLPDYGQLVQQARADRLGARALAWLDARAEKSPSTLPVVLFFQFMEPHYPFSPPAELLERVAGGRAVDVRRVNQNYYIAPRTVPIRDLEDVYDAEVASLDRELRGLFAALERASFLEQAIVVVTADHGEELEDHGGRTHGTTLYEELIRVPLLVHLPGQTAAREEDDPVSLIDVAPTVLDLVGIPPPRRWEGRSVAQAVRGRGPWARLVAAVRGDRPAEERPILSELLPKTKNDRVRHDRALIRGSEKLLVSPAGEVEMFDLAADPDEAKPLDARDRARERLEAPLSALIERIRPGTAPAVPDEIDEKTHERLKALGYAG